jgi:hypothetical protein
VVDVRGDESAEELTKLLRLARRAEAAAGVNSQAGVAAATLPSVSTPGPAAAAACSSPPATEPLPRTERDRVMADDAAIVALGGAPGSAAGRGIHAGMPPSRESSMAALAARTVEQEAASRAAAEQPSVRDGQFLPLQVAAGEEVVASTRWLEGLLRQPTANAKAKMLEACAVTAALPRQEPLFLALRKDCKTVVQAIAARAASGQPVPAAVEVALKEVLVNHPSITRELSDDDTVTSMVIGTAQPSHAAAGANAERCLALRVSVRSAEGGESSSVIDISASSVHGLATESVGSGSSRMAQLQRSSVAKAVRATLACSEPYARRLRTIAARGGFTCYHAVDGVCFSQINSPRYCGPLVPPSEHQVITAACGMKTVPGRHHTRGGGQ